MSVKSSLTLVSCKGHGPNIVPDGDNLRSSNTADAIAVPVVFGVLGLVLTLATIIIGIIQIKIAWKHQHQTANCRIDLEAAVNRSSP